MLIGELVEKTGFSRDTIRFYEKQGLIQVSRSARRENNYKEYSTEIMERLLLIKRIKGFGFTLNEVADFLGLIENDLASCQVVAAKMQEKVELLERKIEELQKMKQAMLEGVEKRHPECAPAVEDENCPAIVSDLLRDRQ